jgi:hypothetical protein
VTRQDLKDWVKTHYGVDLDDRWLNALLREHTLALRRHIERKKTQKSATVRELIGVMIEEIEEAMPTSTSSPAAFSGRWASWNIYPRPARRIGEDDSRSRQVKAASHTNPDRAGGNRAGANRVPGIDRKKPCSWPGC